MDALTHGATPPMDAPEAVRLDEGSTHVLSGAHYWPGGAGTGRGEFPAGVATPALGATLL